MRPEWSQELSGFQVHFEVLKIWYSKFSESLIVRMSRIHPRNFEELWRTLSNLFANPFKMFKIFEWLFSSIQFQFWSGQILSGTFYTPHLLDLWVSPVLILKPKSNLWYYAWIDFTWISLEKNQPHETYFHSVPQDEAGYWENDLSQGNGITLSAGSDGGL